jgi:sialate O-acetylesterase
LILVFALVSASVADAKVVLPQLFQSGMVMQRGKPIPVWGQADAGETVSVTFKKKTYTTTAGADGSWRVDLPQQKAGGPFQLTVNDLVIDNCLIGDVWLLSGQSNIDVTIERVYPQYGKVIDDYSNERIRMFRVQTDTDTHGPKRDVKPTPINWKPVTKDNAWLFSAVGYFLGREMFAKTGVPQGVIVNSVGGTPIQAWLDADTLRQHFPEELQRTVFFQDDEMVRSIQRANMMAQNRWQKMLTDTDPGFADHYADRDYDDSQWLLKSAFNTVNGRQLSQNLTRDFRYTGSFWARQHIIVDAAHAGQQCRLLVGTLYDADQTYVNGRQVGSTGYQYPPRRYTIPEGVLVEGDNALSVRFVTKGGAPHFIPEKPYKLIFDDGTEIALSDEWRIHEGARMPQCPGADGGGQNLPTVLYNAMLYPLAPYALTGMVWYQGESNTGGDARHYETWLTELVTGWRQLWQQPDLPFMVVQLANFMDPSDKPQDTGWSQVREAQRLVAKRQPNTELACIIDLGETVDIHPLRKQEVAQRIALGFERMLWNKKVLLSPEVVSATVNGSTVTLTLDQPLRDNGQLFEFELAGADGRFQNAEATGQGNIITVTSPVAAPVRLRYAWKNNPLRANVFGTTGLPMAPMEIGF